MKKKILSITLLLTIVFCFAQEIKLQEKITGTHWVCSFFNDVLKTKQRDTYYKYSQYYFENQETWNDRQDCFSPWYENNWSPTFMSFNNDGTNLWIASHTYDVKKIEKNKIFVELDENGISRNLAADKYTNLNWGLINNKKKFTFIFEFDGDYVDIYINNKKNLFATFCKYDGYTYNELQHLIKGGDFGPWNINYPKRSNGSIDYVSE